MKKLKRKEQPNLTVVVQHNSLVNSRYDMNLLEMKIFLIMLARIGRDDENFKECSIPVNLFYDKPKGSAYQYIKQSCDSLTKKNIMIEDINRKKFRAFPLMGYCEYSEGEGFLKAEFNEHIKPYLLQLKGNFTMSSLKYLWKLNSVYSIRIYNLLRERKDFKGRTDSLEEFKNMLGIADKYNELYDLRKRVLDVAQKDLADTDLSFEYEMIRKGRRVSHIKFNITSIPEPVQLHLFEKQKIDNENEFTSRALKILEGWGFSKIQVGKIMQADHQQICKVSYAMKMEKPTSINVTGWAYNEFIKRLGL